MAAANPEKENDMILKEPLADDVLLGQGHYRHQGNRRLNEIVDAKVDEYKNQSRVFKTYMAHDIVNRMRSKGVRFLKELAPKGWIVIKDDKEAREKVAQRFQYMMRKRADALAKEKAKTVLPKKANSSSSPTNRPNLNWNGVTVKVPFLPVFHQLQKASVLVDDDINAISTRLLECFQIIGLKEKLNMEEANAVLTTTDNLKMQMNLWKPLGGNKGVLIEVIHLAGDGPKFQKYSRYVLEAATGLFGQYKDTLFLSGATGSVQDHVTAFTTTKPPSKMGSEEPPSIRPGMVKAMSDRALQQNGVRRPSANRLEQSKLVPIAPRPTRLMSLAPREPIHAPVKREPMPMPMSVPVKRKSDVIDDTEALTGCFASAFSRWETGVEAEGKAPIEGQANARRPSAAAKNSANAFGTEAGTGWARHAPHSTAKNPSGFPPGASAQHRKQDAKPNSVTRWRPSPTPSSATAANNGASDSKMSAPCVPNRVTSSTPKQGLSYGYDCETPRANNNSTVDHGRPRQGSDHSDSTESMEPLPLTAAYLSMGTRRSGQDLRHPPAFDRWSAASSSNQEMKECDSSYEERLDAEMASMDQTLESIKRLSLSSNDASYADARNSRDINEAFVGMWPGALSNQEMKCDSSLDDEPYPYGAGNLSSSGTQSFIPSSFFGASAPNANTLSSFRAPNPPSPAHSFGSHFSVEMRSIPSPSPSSSSHVSVEFSLPSPCNSFGSRCSLEVNSLKHARMDEALSPSMFQSDQSTGNGPDSSSRLDAVDSKAPAAEPKDVVPPTIFVDSSSAVLGPTE